MKLQTNIHGLEDFNINKRIVIYCRGGIGDVYAAICAMLALNVKEKILNLNIIFVLDSAYFYRTFPSSFKKSLLDLIHKITPNVIIVPPWINNNFHIEVDDLNDDEFNQEKAEEHFNEFMFWRPTNLKRMINQMLTKDTIFIDAIFSECILIWDQNKGQYNRIRENRYTRHK